MHDSAQNMAHKFGGYPILHYLWSNQADNARLYPKTPHV